MYQVINFLTFLVIVCFSVSIIRKFIQHLYNISHRETWYIDKNGTKLITWYIDKNGIQIDLNFGFVDLMDL